MAQFGSALEWGSRGRKFNSCHPDHAKEQRQICSIFFAKKFRFMPCSFAFRKKQAFCEVLTSFAKIRINLNSLLLNKIRKILILRKAREAVVRLKTNEVCFEQTADFTSQAGFLRGAHFVRIFTTSPF